MAPSPWTFSMPNETLSQCLFPSASSRNTVSPSANMDGRLDTSFNRMTPPGRARTGPPGTEPGMVSRGPEPPDHMVCAAYAGWSTGLPQIMHLPEYCSGW